MGRPFNVKQLAMSALSLPEINSLLQKSSSSAMRCKDPKQVAAVVMDLEFALANKKSEIKTWLLAGASLGLLHLAQRAESLRLPFETIQILSALKPGDQKKYQNLFDYKHAIQWVWSQQNTCIPVSTQSGVVIENGLDLEQCNLRESGVIGGQKITLENHCMEKQASEEVLPKLFQGLYLSHADPGSDLYRMLQKILLDEVPFVTPSRKCAIIVNTSESTPGQIYYIDKEFCAKNNKSYRSFLSHYPI